MNYEVFRYHLVRGLWIAGLLSFATCAANITTW